jgi:hypothetical protein
VQLPSIRGRPLAKTIESRPALSRGFAYKFSAWR